MKSLDTPKLYRLGNKFWSAKKYTYKTSIYQHQTIVVSMIVIDCLFILVHFLPINGSSVNFLNPGIHAIEGGLVSGSRPKIWWTPWSNEHFDDHDAFRYITSMYPGNPYFCCSTQFVNFQCWKMQRKMQLQQRPSYYSSLAEKVRPQ